MSQFVCLLFKNSKKPYLPIRMFFFREPPKFVSQFVCALPPLFSVNQQSTVLACHRSSTILKIFFPRAYGAREPVKYFLRRKITPLGEPFRLSLSTPKAEVFLCTKHHKVLKFSFSRQKLRKRCISHIQVKQSLAVKLCEEFHKQYRLCNDKSDKSMAVAHTKWSFFTARLMASGKHWNMSAH